MEITAQRLKELEDSELKLNCLEAGGVDNWDNYDDALEEKLEELFNDVCEELCQNIEEPAGSGCGYGFTCTDKAFSVFKKGLNCL